MSLGMSGAVVGGEPVALCRSARAQSLASADADGWHSVCGRTADRNHLAAGRRHQRRLRRLLLLPGGPRTQDRIGGHSLGGAGVSIVGGKSALLERCWQEGGKFQTFPGELSDGHSEANCSEVELSADQEALAQRIYEKLQT